MQEKKHELFNAELDQLKELFDKDDRSRDENGFPLLENGEIDWEQTSIEKEAFMLAMEKYMGVRVGKVKSSKGKYPSNYTPPKKKRKK